MYIPVKLERVNHVSCTEEVTERDMDADERCRQAVVKGTRMLGKNQQVRIW